MESYKPVPCPEVMLSRSCEMQLDREEIKQPKGLKADAVERGIQTLPDFMPHPSNPIDIFKVPRSRKKHKLKVKQGESSKSRKRLFYEENFSDRDLYDLGVLL